MPRLAKSPVTRVNLIAAKAETLRAANGTNIYIYEHRSLTRDLGPSRRFRRVFIVAVVPYPIVGIDLFQHFNLLVDARHRKIFDRRTSLAVTGPCAVVNQSTPQYAKPPV